jgi:predicted ester cyclase
VTLEDTVTEGAQQVTRWTARGTHEGHTEEFGPPTGRRIEFPGISIHRADGSRIVEEWECYDQLTVLQQLGLAPQA